MANNIVQLTDDSGNDVFPIAGGMAANSVTKAMLAEGVFEGETLSTPTDVDYVATDNIQDGAVTNAKMACEASHTAKGFSNISVANNTGVNVAQLNVPAGSVVIVSGYIAYPSNSTGYRDALIRLDNNNVISSRVTAVNGSDTRVTVSAVLTPTTASTVYLRANQTSGSTLTVSGALTYLVIS